MRDKRTFTFCQRWYVPFSTRITATVVHGAYSGYPVRTSIHSYQCLRLLALARAVLHSITDAAGNTLSPTLCSRVLLRPKSQSREKGFTSCKQGESMSGGTSDTGAQTLTFLPLLYIMTRTADSHSLQLTRTQQLWQHSRERNQYRKLQPFPLCLVRKLSSLYLERSGTKSIAIYFRPTARSRYISLSETRGLLPRILVRYTPNTHML